jgi:predicted transcriptional regulator
MSHTITVRLDPDLASWLEHAAAETGLSQGQIVREQLRKAQGSKNGVKPFMKLAGVVDGPRDLSRRKGFSKR